MNNFIETYASSFMLTVCEPNFHGYTHDYIMSALRSCMVSDHMTYCCMCDEVAKLTGTLHTHVFVTFEHSVPVSVILFLFPFAHVDIVQISCWTAKNYILKEGSYKLLLEYEENLKDTFEEWRCT